MIGKVLRNLTPGKPLKKTKRCAMYNTDRAFRLKLCVHIGEYFPLLEDMAVPSGGSEGVEDFKL